jgi:hypothetical protein
MPEPNRKGTHHSCFSAVAWDVLDLSQRQYLRVSVGHCAYFMSKSRSFVFV